ncbi:MAG: LysM peptidoglycan-binding domain-containing protein [Chloroflexota bacterium]
MNENAESLPPKHITYQVVATRAGDDHGQTFRARLGPKPFLIGSGKSANMLLDNPQILPVQIRLLSSTAGQVLLTNLGEDHSVLMSGDPVPTLIPTYWKPGLAVTLADFELQLVTLVDMEGEGQMERVRPAIITQASEIAPESLSEPGFVIEWNDSRDLRGSIPEIPTNNTVLFGKGVAENESELEAVEDVEDTREGWRLEATPQESLPQLLPMQPPPPELPVLPDMLQTPLPAVPRLDESESLPTEAMPFLANLAQANASPYAAAPTGNETLPKNWQSVGKLSAQLTNDSVNLVAGERVRIPVSVRNESANAMHLRVHIAGLPRDWTAVLDSALPLMPGDICALDVILETRRPFDQAYLDTLLRIHDQLSPDNYLTLPLRLNFKTAPNIVGRLSPSRLIASQTAYLNLHNHTQVTITTFIAGHSDSPYLHIIPAQSQFDLPPGQNIEIPVEVRPLSRPWLRGKDHRFSVSLRHGNRAALDYPGVARVRPRISINTLLLLVALLIVLFAGWKLLGIGGGGVAPAAIVAETPEITPSLPAVVADTPRPTPGLESTAEVRAVAPPEVKSTSTSTSRPPASDTPLPTTSPVPTHTDAPPLTITIAVTEILPTPVPPTTSIQAIDDPRPAGCTVAIPDGWKPYTVQSGDRVFRLAVTYATTVEEVTRVNCLSDARLLQVGQVLLLPIP